MRATNLHEVSWGMKDSILGDVGRWRGGHREDVEVAVEVRRGWPGRGMRERIAKRADGCDMLRSSYLGRRRFFS